MNQLSPEFEEKVWGSVWHLFRSDHSAVSFLKTRAGFCCSCHLHQDRVNMFAVVSGKITVERECPGQRPVVIQVRAGEICTVPAGIVHRFTVIEPGEVIEVYWPVEDRKVNIHDIVRLDEGGPSEDAGPLKSRPELW